MSNRNAVAVGPTQRNRYGPAPNMAAAFPNAAPAGLVEARRSDPAPWPCPARRKDSHDHEGLAANGRPNPVQEAWAGRGRAPQCGYCKSGQNHVGGNQFISEKPKPTDAAFQYDLPISAAVFFFPYFVRVRSASTAPQPARRKAMAQEKRRHLSTPPVVSPEPRLRVAGLGPSLFPGAAQAASPEMGEQYWGCARHAGSPVGEVKPGLPLGRTGNHGRRPSESV